MLMRFYEISIFQADYKNKNFKRFIVFFNKQTNVGKNKDANAIHNEICLLRRDSESSSENLINTPRRSFMFYSIRIFVSFNQIWHANSFFAQAFNQTVI